MGNNVPPLETPAQKMIVLLRQPGWSYEAVDAMMIRAYQEARDATLAELESMVLHAAALKGYGYVIYAHPGLDNCYIIRLYTISR